MVPAPAYLEERRVNLQVLGDHVEAEEVAVNALAEHGVLVAPLVEVTRRAEQADLLCALTAGEGFRSEGE